MHSIQKLGNNMNNSPILTVKNLKVDIASDNGRISIINRINFKLFKGETLCIVGESGCGKSFTALSIMRLLPNNAKTTGKILFNGKDLLSLEEEKIRKIRGKEISMIFQDPLTSLNPVFTIYDQLKETILAHIKAHKTTKKKGA